jgi:hypothetical protein
MKAPSETSLVRQCLDYLKLRGVFAWRANCTGVRRRDRRGREFWTPAALVGISDLLAVLPPGGRLLAVEAKLGKNDLTPPQAAFLQAVAAAGGLAVVVRDLNDLVAALRVLEAG